MRGIQRLWLVLFLFSGAFVFFSFLANTEGKGKEDLLVFYDSGITENGVVVEHVTECLEEAGYSVRAHEFDPDAISHFLLSHPSALYLTQDPVIARSTSFRVMTICLYVLQQDLPRPEETV